jgi:hypothetical protein
LTFVNVGHHRATFDALATPRRPGDALNLTVEGSSVRPLRSLGYEVVKAAPRARRLRERGAARMVPSVSHSGRGTDYWVAVWCGRARCGGSPWRRRSSDPPGVEADVAQPQDLGVGATEVVSCSWPGRTSEVQIGQPSGTPMTVRPSIAFSSIDKDGARLSE